MTSILNHSSLKVNIEFEWNDNAKAQTKAFMKRRIEAGVPLKDLLDLMHQAAKEAAKAQEAPVEASQEA